MAENLAVPGDARGREGRQLSWSGRAKVFRRRDAPAPTRSTSHDGNIYTNPHDQEKANEPDDGTNPNKLPVYNAHGHRVNHQGHRVTKGIHPDGESGRRWIHPGHMVKICWRSASLTSKWVNVLWPFTIAAMVLYFADIGKFGTRSVLTFAFAYIGMVPAANLVGFAGQELARKIPKVWGVLLETTFGSIVEIILFMVLITRAHNDASSLLVNLQVIRAAILGSILANLLLCLGLCFFVGGIYHPQQTFHDAISEVGSNLMLVAGFGLVIPTIYYNSLTGTTRASTDDLSRAVLKISHATAIILLAAFIVYVWFQAKSHHGLYEDILEQDELRDHDRHKDLAKDKLTLSESILALAIGLTFVSFMAVILVDNIHYIVERGVSDAFVGLILVPLVEKVSEHLTAIDEAYDNQMNFALSHILGASIQTALLNTPLVVIVGWGLGVPLDLNFELFDAVVIIMAIIVVGNFLRDEKSDYLEGALSVFVYLLIAITAWYYPNPDLGEASGGESAHR
ncbi:uncharacterized protein K489DRAFT_383795 [Dissoconium aciculare CBS 342.82]|uniref:Vacuolar calcium ion transporter n=1 Tax=Dissoconium aciculare CBS 342.82 TaxID=1314786 RepID=A0A6J3LUW5_9PEZI|nr:uncharacterized protein K489DRAFT_383795 [Dissoconium aciculare CBS 342.82]KAF1819561.1 hypothetical protein K489DRAFT_383795 [Dissoconium aciculare CBS 342.82]